MCKIVGFYQCKVCLLPILFDSDINSEEHTSYVPSKYFENKENPAYYFDVTNGVEVQHGHTKALFKNRLFATCPECSKEVGLTVTIFELTGFQYVKDENVN